MTLKSAYVRPTRTLIHASALEHNWKNLVQRMAPSTRILAIVKANGYGHGSVAVAQAVQALGACGVGVADMAEAIVLREGGYTGEVLCLGAAPPSALAEAAARGIIITFFQPKGLETALEFANRTGQKLRAHIEVETGMHRLGIEEEDWRTVAQRLASTPQIQTEGLFTHLAESENPDAAFTTSQLDKFALAVQTFETTLGRRLVRHASNSGGVLAHVSAHFDWVRPGIALYGYPPREVASIAPAAFRPVLEWRAPIIQLKTIAAGDTVGYNRRFRAKKRMTIATIAAGYGDGYRRGYQGVGLGFRRERIPMVGTVCMDLLMTDVSKFPDVQLGEEVSLLGGPGAPDAYELAQAENTVPYEVLTGISARVSREWVSA